MTVAALSNKCLEMALLILSNVWTAFTVACLAVYVSLSFHHRIEWVSIWALFILVWQVFTLDRFIVHPEDQQRTDLDLNIARFIRLHRPFFLAGLIGSVFLLITMCLIKPHLFFGFVYAGFCSVLYIFPVPFLAKRFKQISYLKSFYVPFVAVTSLILFTQSFPLSFNEALIYLLIYVLLALNGMLFDIKDVKADRCFGIKTFASKLGPRLLIWIEFTISILLGLGLVRFGGTPSFLALGITFLFYGPAALGLLKKKSVTYLFTAIDGMGVLVLMIYLLLI